MTGHTHPVSAAPVSADPVSADPVSGPTHGHPGAGADSGRRLRPGHPAVPVARVDYAKRPMLVFWETTRACGLAPPRGWR